MAYHKNILRALRLRAGHTTAQCAELLGVVESHIKKAEATRAPMSDRKFALLLEVYGVNLEQANLIASLYLSDKRLKARNAKKEDIVLDDLILGTSAHGKPIRLFQMVNWLQYQTPIKPEHGEALRRYIERKEEEYRRENPDNADDLI